MLQPFNVFQSTFNKADCSACKLSTHLRCFKGMEELRISLKPLERILFPLKITAPIRGWQVDFFASSIAVLIIESFIDLASIYYTSCCYLVSNSKNFLLNQFKLLFNSFIVILQEIKDVIQMFQTKSFELF